ncbi:MAG: hypothetical protein RI939_1360, partial [Actinomycetota bacterium]
MAKLDGPQVVTRPFGDEHTHGAPAVHWVSREMFSSAATSASE